MLILNETYANVTKTNINYFSNKALLEQILTFLKKEIFEKADSEQKGLVFMTDQQPVLAKTIHEVGRFSD